ncbi:MAG TPA: chemotaxis protein CheW [Rectinemataceae bacterium]|nr:chemotaxis protein CheW [Rectinemataceae bacterium]
MDGMTLRRYLAFDLEGSVYAIDVERVEVVLEMVPVTRVPRSSEHLRGVINHRGTVIPVADLRVRFGEGLTDLAKAGSIIVMQLHQGSDSVTIGILADSVREVIDFDSSKIERAPAFGKGGLDKMVQGVYGNEGAFIVVLDVDKVFEDLSDEL